MLGEMVRLTTAPTFIPFTPYNFVSDIDECSSNSNSCDANAVCNNIRGSYTCECKPGYSGDGNKCTGKLLLLNKNYRSPWLKTPHYEMTSHEIGPFV